MHSTLSPAASFHGKRSLSLSIISQIVLALSMLVVNMSSTTRISLKPRLSVCLISSMTFSGDLDINLRPKTFLPQKLQLKTHPRLVIRSLMGVFLETSLEQRYLFTSKKGRASKSLMRSRGGVDDMPSPSL